MNHINESIVEEQQDDPYVVDEITAVSDELIEIKSKIELKTHQLALIAKCIELENGNLVIDDGTRLNNLFTTIGIIGDKVGSGKSYSVLGLFLANSVPKVRRNVYQSVGMGHILFKFKPKTFKKYLNTNVIVCSFGLLKQWKEYVSNFSDDFVCMTVSTKASLAKYKNTYDDYNIIIVSNSFYRFFADFVLEKSIHFNRCVFDEVDSVSIVSAKEIPCYFTWCVTATYKNVLHPYPGYSQRDILGRGRMIYTGIQNNSFIKNVFLSIIKSLYNTSHIKYINKLVIKCADSFVDDSFKLPEPTKEIYICENSAINILSGVTNLNIIQSLNAGDVKTALSFLNEDRVGSQARVVSLVKESMNIELSNLKIKIRSTNEMTFNTEEQKIQRLSVLQKNADNLIKKINLLEKRIVECEHCSICFDELTQKTVTNCCSNSFCFKCICTWINLKPNQTCPLCKNSIDSKNLYVVTGENITQSSNQPKIMDKYETLEKILKSKFDVKQLRPKIVIFSEFDNTFNKVQDILNSMKITYAFLKGNSINRTVARFNNNNECYYSVDVLLANCKSYGSGLNLENTTDLIMFHKFDNMIEQQVIGRSQRPGRTKSLNIHYLLYKNEL